jgi:hypothetical protein
MGTLIEIHAEQVLFYSPGKYKMGFNGVEEYDIKIPYRIHF